MTAEIITIDKRSDRIYSASLYIPSESRPALKHHVTLWFEVLYDEDIITGRIRSIELIVRKASCSCEAFTFRSQCKHIAKAKQEIIKYFKNKVGGVA